jgi:hypothetical protein
LLPSGNVFAGVVNAIAYIGKTPVFDSATLMAETNFSHLVSVSQNGAFYYGQGYNCPSQSSGFPYGCATKNQVGIDLKFEPKWFEVFNGVDLSMPLFLDYGIHGNSSVPFGSNQGQGSYSIGVTADVKNQYTATLAFNGFIAKHADDAAGASSLNNSALGKYWDRDWVSLTLKTTF